jgi:hypothetical protein
VPIVLMEFPSWQVPCVPFNRFLIADRRASRPLRGALERRRRAVIPHAFEIRIAAWQLRHRIRLCRAGLATPATGPRSLSRKAQQGLRRKGPR